MSKIIVVFTLFLTVTFISFASVSDAKEKNTLKKDSKIALKALNKNRQAITIGINAREGLLREIQDVGLCYWRVFEGSPAQRPGASKRQVNQDMAADILALSAANALAIQKTSQFSYWTQGSLRGVAKHISDQRIRRLLLSQVRSVDAWRAVGSKDLPVCQILAQWKENNYKRIRRLADAYLGNGGLEKLVDSYWQSVQDTFIGAHVIEQSLFREASSLYLSVYSRSQNTYDNAWKYLENSSR